VHHKTFVRTFNPAKHLKNRQIFFSNRKRSVCFNGAVTTGYCQIFYIFAQLGASKNKSIQPVTKPHFDFTDKK